MLRSREAVRTELRGLVIAGLSGIGLVAGGPIEWRNRILSRRRNEVVRRAGVRWDKVGWRRRQLAWQHLRDVLAEIAEIRGVWQIAEIRRRDIAETSIWHRVRQDVGKSIGKCVADPIAGGVGELVQIGRGHIGHIACIAYIGKSVDR